jgi:rare lipoprotein A
MGNFGRALIIVWSAFYLFGCASPQRATVLAQREEAAPGKLSSSIGALPRTRTEAPTFTQTGIASWYRDSTKLRRTAAGEKLASSGFTAAHRSLPFGAIVLVTSLRTGRTVLVRINDRGPFVQNRIIDISYGAAASLGIVNSGLADVRIAVYKSDQCDVTRNSTLCSSQGEIASSLH